jgi:hypothetical protein
VAELILRGFVLTLLLGVLLTSGLACGEGGEELYNADRSMMQKAALEYVTRCITFDCNYYSPVVGYDECYRGDIDIKGAEIDSEELYCPLAVGPLLMSSFPVGNLDEVPASCAEKNCFRGGANAEAGITTCEGNCIGHYLWLISLDRHQIASLCIGDECRSSDEDGFQGVYP